MAINPLSVPNYGGPYSGGVDFAPLGNLINSIIQRQQESAAADLLGSLYQNQQQQTPYVPSLGGGGDGGGGIGGGGGASPPLNPQVSVRPGSGPSYPPLGNISGYPTALGTGANYMGWGQPNALGNATTGVPAPAPPVRPTSSTGMAAVGVPALLNALTRTQPTAPGPPTMAAPGIPNMAAAYPSAASAAYPPTVGETAKPAAFSGADQPTEVTPEDRRRVEQAPERVKQRWETASKVVAELKKQGFSDNAIAGILYNINRESGFNPSSRAADQPRFGGEAHYAHGLFQEGGDEWNTFASDPNRAKNWQDPTEQARFVAGRLKGEIGNSQYANVNQALQNARTPEEAAKIFAAGYLKPAQAQLSGRIADINRGIPQTASAYTEGSAGRLPPEITQGRSTGAAPGGAPPPGTQLAQNAGPFGGITREQLIALARNPVTAPLAQQLVMQQLSPKLIETGTDPLTGQKSFAQQIGNRLVPVQGEGGAGAAGGSGGLFDKLTQMQTQGASKEQMLAAIPAGYRSGVQALIEGRDLPANYGKANVKASMDMLAQIVDPNFNPARIPIRQGMQREFSPQGKTGQSLIAFGTAQHHIDEASDAVEELAKYQGKYPTINAMRAAVAAHGGDQQLADATQRFNDAMQAVGKEVAHAYSNGHLGEHEMAQWNALISSNLPPDRLRRGLFDFTRLLNGKRDTLNDTYRQEFGKDVPSINKEENEAVSRKVFSRLPDYAPEKQAAQAGVGGNTGGKSPIVIQNGHTYTLQPDGSYK